MLYKYCDPRGIDILRNRRLKASKIQELNDPFELAFGIDEETAVEKMTAEYNENPKILGFWKRVLRSQKIAFNPRSKTDIIEKTAHFQVSDLNKVTIIIKEKWDTTMGVTCLTEDPSVIQMWAHYTGNHSGFVIGVDEKVFVKDSRALVKVEYCKDMLLLPVTGDMRKLAEYEKHIAGLLGRKEEKWAYENERRLYLRLLEKNIDGNYYSEIPAAAIQEIYLGLNSSELNLKEVQSLRLSSGLEHLKVFKMTRHKLKYKLIPIQIH